MVEFESEELRRIGRGSHDIKKVIYKVVRRETEVWNKGQQQRSAVSFVEVFEITETGEIKLSDSQAADRMKKVLPLGLADVFFTDGDAALAFIASDATQGEKRKKVLNALQKILGLELFESLAKHCEAVRKDFAEEGQDDVSVRLAELERYLEEARTKLADKESKLVETGASLARLNKDLERIEQDIEDILKKGNRESLVADKQRIEKRIKKEEEEEHKVLAQLGDLVGRSKPLSLFMVGD